jgi:hypothetical protein
MPEAVRITLWIEPASGTSRKPKDDADADGEPPLKFQTVARLNLAGVSFGSAISNPSSEQPQAPPQPDGGNP